MSVVANDVTVINESLNQVSLTLVGSSVVLFFGSLIVMFVLDAWFAFLVVATVLLGIAATGVVLIASGKHFEAQQSELGALNGFVEEVYPGRDVVELYNARRRNRREFDRANDRLYRASLKAEILSDLLTPIMGAVVAAGTPSFAFSARFG